VKSAIDADFDFKLSNLSAHRGDGHAHIVGCRPHRTQLGRFIEIAEIQILHVIEPL